MSSQSSDQFKIFDLAQHARMKGMWAGSISPTTIPNMQGLTPDLNLIKITNPHTRAGLQSWFKELVTNVTDHVIISKSNRSKNKRVTYFHVNFNKSGVISYENNGPGIPILVNEVATSKKGRTVYNPEVAFGMFLAGSNMEKPPDCVKGGINGLGAKLANIHSKIFVVRTCDHKSKKLYTQRFEDRMKIINLPKIESIDISKNPSHTNITLLPAYEELGYNLKGGKKISLSDYSDLNAWLRLLLHQAAAYVGPDVEVLLNGIRCETTNATDLLRLIAFQGLAETPDIHSCIMKHPEDPFKKHKWDVAISVLPGSNKFSSIMVVNGVICTKGPHLQYIKKEICNSVQTVTRKLIRDSKLQINVTEACKRLFLVFIGAIPGADWSGQCKDELDMPSTEITRYAIPAAFLKSIATCVAEDIIQSMGSTRNKKTRKNKVHIDKYTRARKEGTRYRDKCYLLAAEGDSAISLLRAGLTLGKKNPGGPSFDYYGIISLGGVIMNALRNINEIKTPSGNGTTIIRNEKLKSNKTLTAIVDALGLDYALTYETDEEISTLNYGGLIGCVDQDLDGCGKILPLLMTFIHLFWPKLIERGYLKRFLTPVIRVTSSHGRGKFIKEFYYENEYEEWAKNNPSKVNVKYYKGLATHDSHEVISMFKNFQESIYTLSLDDITTENNLFYTYYGADSSLRKIELSTPVQYLTTVDTKIIRKSKVIPCSTQLQVDAKAYKLDDLTRKIPHVLDGMNRSRRKVLTGAILAHANNSKERKVFQLGGFIAEKMFYHHGDASLNGTIVNMAQCFPGARQYPYLSGIGQFGSRHMSDDAGSPRYIAVRLAAPFVNSMFPQEDKWLLPYTFDEGERAEPEYYLPVLPMAVLESVSIPSEGWNHNSTSRDLGCVVNIVRALIRGEEYLTSIMEEKDISKLANRIENEQFPLNPSYRNFTGTIKAVGGTIYSYGVYSYNEISYEITITELPIGVVTESFIKSLTDCKKASAKTRNEFIEQVNNHSSDVSINIIIKLKKNVYQNVIEKYRISSEDGMVMFLGLRSPMRSNLNYMNCDGTVLECNNDYIIPIIKWFPHRMRMYHARYQREEILLRCKLILESNIIRYISEVDELNLSNIQDEDEAKQILKSKDYPSINVSMLKSPKYTPIDDLEQSIMQGDMMYDYILDLRARDLVHNSVSRRRENVIKLEMQLEEVNGYLNEQPFPAASVWLLEIEQVCAAIDRGIATNWKF